MKQWDESLHPRDPAGRSTGGQFVSLKSKVEAGMAPMTEGEFRDRVQEPDGGFTYDPVTQAEPRWGFAVSTRPDLSQAFDPKDFSFEMLAAYVMKNEAVFADKENRIGAWTDPKTMRGYLDVSRVVGSLKEAVSLARKHDQIAVFVLHEGRSVVVDQNAKSGGAAL